MARDKDGARKALENVGFLVVQATNQSETLEYASVVLPMTAPAESEGTFINLERRVQRFSRVLPPRGEAKPAWRVYSELMLRTKPETPLFNAKDVMEEIADHVPAFEGARYEALPEEGFVLG
jgi:predicted molibdopterin-dependent oxidoreductase YjgC